VRLLSSPGSRFDVEAGNPSKGVSDFCPACVTVSFREFRPLGRVRGVFALVGPTGSGKTDLAVSLAQRFGAEILCADAMTIWRGLDVGTAKPDAASRAKVPHHLLDLFEPGERPTVAEVGQIARRAIHEIQDRGKSSLVTGGSGLYVRAIVDGIEFPPTDSELRAQLENLPLDELVRRLGNLDPDSDVDLRNSRRVIRALEITLLTGTPASAQRDAWERRADVPMIGLLVAPDVLEQRIRARTDAMLRDGWESECRQFDSKGARAAVLATQALGYQQIFDLIDGKMTSTEAAESIVVQTLKLAKRQLTWFRADPRVLWVDADDPAAALQATEAHLAPLLTRSGHT
jgi:tRNA dimethylallyltransferase